MADLEDPGGLGNFRDEEGEERPRTQTGRNDSGGSVEQDVYIALKTR